MSELQVEMTGGRPVWTEMQLSIEKVESQRLEHICVTACQLVEWNFLCMKV